ncbi:hypothetical protein NUSPORA_01447 [Nucleospora cyclopteri]
MGFLHFITGPVSSGKTIDLLMKAHNLEKIHGKNSVKIMKPSFDTRAGFDKISSSIGISKTADFIIEYNQQIDFNQFQPSSFLFVDEIQFYKPCFIKWLRELSIKKDVNIYCYGLMKDFRNELFETAGELTVLCDELITFKTFCHFCKLSGGNQVLRTANTNMKIIKSKENEIIPTKEGHSKCVGGIEMFIPVCQECYFKSFISLKSINK